MIDRIVLVSLLPEYATDSGRAEVAAHARAVLGALPGVVDVRTGLAADPPAAEVGGRSWDVSFIVRITSLDAYPAYRDHPAHKAFLEGFLAPRCQFKKAWNFEVDPR